jgi:predicted metalloendopeptidase
MTRVSWPLLLLSLVTWTTQAQHLESGIDKIGFDRSVRPQDDLFRFVNGEWLKHTQIPADKSNYGSFIELSDEAQINLTWPLSGNIIIG